VLSAVPWKLDHGCQWILAHTAGWYAHLHPRASAVVCRVVRADKITPLLGRLDVLAVGAGIGPSRGILRGRGARDEETSIRHTRVHGSSLEHIGIRPDEHVGHHSARASSDCEHSVLVAAVLLHCVLDHIYDGLAVATAVVGKT
jgi:hypothetical protein